jgi:hypothetical protein
MDLVELIVLRLRLRHRKSGRKAAQSHQPAEQRKGPCAESACALLLAKRLH